MFSDRSHSKKGIISTILGVLSIGALIILAISSSLSGGNGSLLVGGLGIIALIVSFIGFTLGISSCKEDEVYYSYPVVGTSLNGIIFVIYIIIYLMGTFL